MPTHIFRSIISVGLAMAASVFLLPLPPVLGQAPTSSYRNLVGADLSLMERASVTPEKAVLTPELVRRIKAHRGSVQDVSPDGRWVLFRGVRSTEPCWWVLAMEGTQEISFPIKRDYVPSLSNEASPLPSAVQWLPDSTGFVETEATDGEDADGYGVIVSGRRWHLASPDKAIVLPPVRVGWIKKETLSKALRDLREGLTNVWPPENYPPRMREVTVACLQTTEERALAVHQSAPNKVSVYSWNWRTQNASPEVWKESITLPIGYCLVDYRVSPKGERIALWLMDSPHHDGNVPPTRRGKGRIRLWVSELGNGSSRKPYEVGSIPIPEGNPHWYYEHLSANYWLSDNKQFTFWLDGKQMVVSVP
jgi:hypothetical protein